MQTKDIPDLPILAFLAVHGGIGCNWFGKTLGSVSVGYWPNERTVRHAMPDDAPEALVHAKMRRLIRRGLVDGCDCGCRGDFELTAKGEALLAAGSDAGTGGYFAFVDGRLVESDTPEGLLKQIPRPKGSDG